MNVGAAVNVRVETPAAAALPRLLPRISAVSVVVPRWFNSAAVTLVWYPESAFSVTTLCPCISTSPAMLSLTLPVVLGLKVRLAPPRPTARPPKRLLTAPPLLSTMIAPPGSACTPLL